MLELFIAFGAGLISFLSPCVLPLIPGYVSFITGSTLSEILEKKKIDLLPLIVFSLGFSFVFIELPVRVL
jgi:cytochrome c-type biogenesis protein